MKQHSPAKQHKSLKNSAERTEPLKYLLDVCSESIVEGPSLWVAFRLQIVPKHIYLGSVAVFGTQPS